MSPHYQACLSMLPTYITALLVPASLHHSTLRSMTHRLCAQQASAGRLALPPSHVLNAAV